MSAKDVIVKVLRNNTNYVTQDDISSSPMVKTPEAIFEEDIPDVAQQILDSLPKLDNKEVANILDDMQGEVRIGRAGYFKKAVNQICSLIPAGEVIATGKLINGININKPGSDYPKVWICDIAKKLINRVGQSGKLIWVPDKEVEDE